VCVRVYVRGCRATDLRLLLLERAHDRELLRVDQHLAALVRRGRALPLAARLEVDPQLVDFALEAVDLLRALLLLRLLLPQRRRVLPQHPALLRPGVLLILLEQLRLGRRAARRPVRARARRLPCGPGRHPRCRRLPR